MGETENPTAYVQRQLKRFRWETEKDPERDPVMTTLFREAIVDAMPQAVKGKLEDVDRHKEFCDHVTQAVEQYRKKQQKLKNQK